MSLLQLRFKAISHMPAEAVQKLSEQRLGRTGAVTQRQNFTPGLSMSSTSLGQLDFKRKKTDCDDLVVQLQNTIAILEIDNKKKGEMIRFLEE